MKKILLVLTAALGFQLTVTAQISPIYQGLFQHILDSVCQKNHIKGVSAAILIPKEGTWKGAYGESYAGEPITTDMVLPIGSNTKTFTASTILLLQEKGLLNINDTIGKWLQNIPNVNGQITIKQLLNHTSGLNDYTQNPAFFTALNSDYNHVWQPEEMLQWIDAPNFAPGASWDYSNTNFLLAGLIIKKIQNESYDQSVRKLILDPQGLTSSFTYPAEIPNATIPHGWSVLVSQHLEDLQVNYNFSNIAFLSMASSAGAIMSTAEDNVKFWNNLMAGQIINSTSLAQMKEFVYINANNGYGLGLFRLQPVNGRKIYNHGGTCFGYLNENLFDSVSGVCITVLSNQDSVDNDALFNKLVTALHKATIHMPPAAVADVQGNADINIYPNPAADVVQVHAGHMASGSVLEVFDMAGRIISKQPLQEGLNTISLREVANGLYMTKITGNGRLLYAGKIQVLK